MGTWSSSKSISLQIWKRGDSSSRYQTPLPSLPPQFFLPTQKVFQILLLRKRVLMGWVVGGGVHDKKIRFYNTFHGTLALTLAVDAQITTLIWSPSTNEILATFGYTASGISTKCAVYAYPSLQCLFAFQIADEIRALYAVVSPSGREICLAGSDECIRFYKIWGEVNLKEEGGGGGSS